MVPTTVYHIGYMVDDLPAAAERFADAFGAGPFHAFEHIVFEEVTYRGGQAVRPAAPSHVEQRVRSTCAVSHLSSCCR